MGVSCAGATRVLAAGLAIAACAASHAEPTAEPMVVVVTVNAGRAAEVFALRTADGDFLLTAKDLRRLGLRDGGWPIVLAQGEPHVALRSIAGLQARLDTATLSLHLTAQPDLLEHTVLQAGPRQRAGERIGQDSGFLNWAVEHVHSSDGARARLSSEGGLRLGPVLLQSSASWVPKGPERRQPVRLSTTAYYDDFAALRRWTMGDFFIAPAELGGAVQLGGFAVSRAFGLDPAAIRHPLGSVQGQLAFPSEVEVLIDGLPVRSERLQAGTFEIRDLISQQGARDVQLRVRDPFGRVQQIDYAFYTSDLLLQAGLHEYRYAWGALRRGYGLRSNDYGPAAYSAVHRWGFSDRVTLGVQAEGRSGLSQLGLSAAARLGDSAGVLSGTYARSRAGGLDGQAAVVRYAWQGGPWSLGASLRHESPRYAVLSEGRTVSNRRAQGLAHLARSLGGLGTLSVSYSRQSIHDAAHTAAPAGFIHLGSQPGRAAHLAFSSYLPALRASFRIALERRFDERGRRTELTAGLSAQLDGLHLLSAQARHHSGGDQAATMHLSRPLPLGPGWGWQLDADRIADAAGSHRHWRGSTQFNGRHAQWRGTWDQSVGGRGTLRLTAAGGIAWLDGRSYFSRPIDDSFALARVGGVADLPIRVNGLEAGHTDARGELFLPSIGAFYTAEVALDARQLPIDTMVARMQRLVVLPARTGGVIDFEATRLRAVLARLVRAIDASPLSVVRIRVQHATGPAQAPLDAVTGRDGELYLENLAAGRHEVHATDDSGATCRFALDIDADAGMFTDFGTLACR
ncbi:fimbria/pilus outer membrane usher protein [Ramlibacter sp. AN1015]|uniref:fimbria/pilus outer membrane usher protein n=1 Tax=Ramlibacter sp. AN1015 TaxID=3133428 RepID=UPI0030BCC8A0